MKRLLPWIVIVALGAGVWYWTSADDFSTEFERLGAEAERMHALKDHATSERFYARAARIAEEAGAWREHYAFRAQRGVCLKMLGRHDEARTELLDALQWASDNGELRTQGLALGNLAKLASWDGDEAGALARMEELIEVAEQGNDPRTVILSLQQTASAHLRQGDPEGALARVERALAVQAEAVLEDGEDFEPTLQLERAWILARLGDDEGAAKLWDAWPSTPSSLARRGQQLSQLERHAEAAELALQAASAFGAGDPSARDQALLLHVEELLLDGEFDAAAGRLSDWTDPASGAEALAPFRILEGRLAWQRGDVPRALALFEAAAFSRPELIEAQWMRALALDELDRGDEALELMESIPESLASSLVRAWIQRDDVGGEGARSDSVPLLLPPDATLQDTSLTRLRRLSPLALPSMSWMALHLHLADGDRLAARGREDVRTIYRRRGLRAALQWQILETAAAVLGRWPEREQVAPSLATLEQWLSGELREDEAIVYVVGGPGLSYLVLFTREWGGTSFGLPPLGDLADRAAELATALRGEDVDAIAAEAYRLFRLLFSAKAQEDLREKRLVSLVLPEELAGLPPGLLVSAEPLPGQTPRWWVRERDLRLLPIPPAAPVAADGVLRAGSAAPSPEDSRVLLPPLLREFGAGLLRPLPFLEREGDDVEFLRGEALNASALRARTELGRWELSLSGAGVGRRGVLLLSPDPDAERVDEQLGLLPFARLASWPLPAELVLDRTRFDPATGGSLQAATAAFLGGARSVLLTRWPLSDSLREAQLGPDPGLLLDPGQLCAMQRAWIDGAESAGSLSAAHPRRWAPWMLFGGNLPSEER